MFFLLGLFTLIKTSANGQQTIKTNTPYAGLSLQNADTLRYVMELQKAEVIQFVVEQLGIAVAYELSDEPGDVKMRSRVPEDITGLLKSEYVSPSKGKYMLKIFRFPSPENTESGKLSVLVKSLSKTEVARRQKIRNELASENLKTVMTADIDHFWQAFDLLPNCKTRADSLDTFQRIYLDRATDGLLDFIAARDITAEKLVQAVGRYPKFYASTRRNTYAVKNNEVLIQEVFKNFKALYSNFKPFKVCFAIGIANTGGTVSGNFVLIGTEIAAASDNVDVSEFIKEKNVGKAKTLSAGGNVLQKVRNMIAHECVHTQQPPLPENAKKCVLLSQVLREGICDFVGEKVAGQQINGEAHLYGDSHEPHLWQELKMDLCSSDISKWLYNGGTSGTRPADLGYYMGYRIAKSYYEQATDKKKAIADMIELTDPQQFLAASRYGQTFKK